jgi:hypothetical protein
VNSTDDAPLVAPGTTVRLARKDLFDGSAPVIVLIQKIDPDMAKISGLEWIFILVTDPERPNAEPRVLLVRTKALRQPPTQAGQPDQQADPPSAAASASPSNGHGIPSQRRPSDATAGGEGTPQLVPARARETGQ